MRHSNEEIIALMSDPNSIHHLPKPEFTEIIRERPYGEALGKKIIFINLKYWISFRIALNSENPEEGMSNEQKILFKCIYGELFRLTENGKITCVLSDSILTELEKMPLQKRLETAKIMDSLHVTIVLNGINTLTFEYINIDRIIAGKEPIEHYHLSSVFESNRFLAAVTLNKIGKEVDLIYNLMYDSMSGMTVAEYLQETDGGFHDSSEKFAEMMNNTKNEDTTNYTHKELLIRGLASQIKSLRKLIKYIPISDLNPAKQLSLYRKSAPFLYLHSAIHAALNIEKSRKIHKNDFYDLSHSCIGVTYADYFFTEKKFHHLLISGPINCNKHYTCGIYSEPSKILEFVKQL